MMQTSETQMKNLLFTFPLCTTYSWHCTYF